MLLPPAWDRFSLLKEGNSTPLKAAAWHRSSDQFFFWPADLINVKHEEVSAPSNYSEARVRYIWWSKWLKRGKTGRKLYLLARLESRWAAWCHTYLKIRLIIIKSIKLGTFAGYVSQDVNEARTQKLKILLFFLIRGESISSLFFKF